MPLTLTTLGRLETQDQEQRDQQRPPPRPLGDVNTMPALRYWSVSDKNRRYMSYGVLAETAEEAVRIVNVRTHDTARRLGYPGEFYYLPTGEYLVNLTFVGTKDDPHGNTPLGWALLRQAPDRRAFQHELVRFVTDEEAATLKETRVKD